MKDYLDSQTLAVIASRTAIAPVYFLWMKPRNRATGVVEPLGVWSGWEPVTVEVIDPDTRNIVTRAYQPAANVVEWPAVNLETGLMIRNVRFKLSQIAAAAQLAIRGYEPKHAPVEYHVGFLSTSTKLMVAPAVPVFVGKINGAPITTPPVRGEGGIEVTCVSDTRELTRTNPISRSDEMQRLRVKNGVPDRLRQYSDAVDGWYHNLHWGEKKAAPASTAPSVPIDRRGIFGR